MHPGLMRTYFLLWILHYWLLLRTDFPILFSQPQYKELQSSNPCVIPSLLEYLHLTPTISHLYHHLCTHLKICTGLYNYAIKLLCNIPSLIFTHTLLPGTQTHMESRKLLGENCDPKRKRKVATKGGGLEECFEVVHADAHVAQQQTSLFWLEYLQLQETDRDELLNGEWLTDKHISTVSKLLQQQHRERNGLQDSVQWWRKNTKISIGQAKVRAFNTTSYMKF